MVGDELFLLRMSFRSWQKLKNCQVKFGKLLETLVKKELILDSLA
jgi:hypothetical protein